MSQPSELIANKPEISNTILYIPVFICLLQDTLRINTHVQLITHIKIHFYFAHLKLSISPSVDHAFPK